LEGVGERHKDAPWIEMSRESLLHEKARRHPDSMAILVSLRERSAGYQAAFCPWQLGQVRGVNLP
jgi:hypothetical protein